MGNGCGYERIDLRIFLWGGDRRVVHTPLCRPGGESMDLNSRGEEHLLRGDPGPL